MRCAQTDFVGIAIHCATGGGICAKPANAPNARADSLPDEMGGYSGFKGLFGSKYVNPAIAGGAGCVNDTSATPGHPSPIVDPFGQCGFPGFDGMTAKDSLGITASMQEAGVPVTFTYVSDAHDNHGNSGNIHVAYGPGEAGYVQQLKDYDVAFQTFFNRLKSDGITKDNSLFVVTVEEGDHFAGTAPDAACDGVTTPCTYANGHVTEANGDLRRIIATVQRRPWHERDDAVQRPRGHGTERLHQRTTRLATRPRRAISRRRCRTSPSRIRSPAKQQSLFVAMADPVEEKLLHMVTADPAADADVHAVRAGRLLPQRVVPDEPADQPGALRRHRPGRHQSLRVPAGHHAAETQTFAWNHGGVQPEVASTWVGFVGPGIENDRPSSTTTSSRITRTCVRRCSSLLGLKDSYVSDGRVLTEILKGDALPKGLNGKTAEDLGQAYKQINASFGQFSMDTLTASTGALASNTPGDTTYTDTEAALQGLGAERDALAGQIRMALWNAEFNGQKIDEKQAKDWIEQADDLLDRAARARGVVRARARDAKELEEDQPHRRHLRGEPQLRQPLRRLGGRERAARTPTPRTRPRSTRRGTRTPA